MHVIGNFGYLFYSVNSVNLRRPAAGEYRRLIVVGLAPGIYHAHDEVQAQGRSAAAFRAGKRGRRELQCLHEPALLLLLPALHNALPWRFRPCKHTICELCTIKAYKASRSFHLVPVQTSPTDPNPDRGPQRGQVLPRTSRSRECHRATQPTSSGAPHSPLSLYSLLAASYSASHLTDKHSAFASFLSFGVPSAGLRSDVGLAQHARGACACRV